MKTWNLIIIIIINFPSQTSLIWWERYIPWTLQYILAVERRYNLFYFTFTRAWPWCYIQFRYFSSYFAIVIVFCFLFAIFILERSIFLGLFLEFCLAWYDVLSLIIYIFQEMKDCRIWGFHGGDYEECRLLGCGAV
jgi:hypothetical protein